MPWSLHQTFRLTFLVWLGFGLSSVAFGQNGATNGFDGLVKQFEKLYQEGKYAEALPVAQQSLTLSEKEFGPDHPNTAESLGNLAMAYRKTGDFKAAGPLYLRSLKIREAVLGPDHLETATSQNNLATYYFSLGDYSKAELHFKLGLNGMEKALGPEHADTAASLNNLAMLYREMADYAKAEAFFERSLKIKEKTLGPDSPGTAKSLNNLAALYKDMGNYAKAEPLYLRSLKIQEATLGAEHPDTAGSLNNLATFYHLLGDFPKAEALCLRSLTVMEKTFGTNHPATATLSDNLAGIYEAMGSLKQAEPLYQRSLKLRELALGPEHPDVANSLNSLAGLFDTLGEHAKAEPLYQRALKILETALGTEHPLTAATLNNLAALYDSNGEYVKAEPLYRRSLQIREKVLGPEHPDTAASLVNLGALEINLKRFDAALAYAKRARALSESGLGHILLFASESQRMAYQKQLDPYSLLATLGSAPDLAEVLLRNKGVVLDSLLEDQRAAEAATDPKVKALVDQLQVAGRQLSQLKTEVPKEDEPDTEQVALEQKIEALHKSLTRSVSGVGTTRRALRTTLADIQANLPQDAVLLEYVRYQDSASKANGEPRYGVLLIGGSRTSFNTANAGVPVWVPLASAESLEPNLKAYATAMRFGKRGDEVVLQKLYAQVFEPIERQLPNGVRTLIVSPDSQLNFLNLGTLVSGDGKFVAERFFIKYVGVGRDLVVPASKTLTRQVVAFANPTFSAKAAQPIELRANPTQPSIGEHVRRDYNAVALTPLPGTLLESDFLRSKASKWRMEVAKYEGVTATEAELHELQSPYVLHVATHGFFLPEEAADETRKVDWRLSGKRRAAPLIKSPMQRSALALAGAQTTLDAWKQGEVPPSHNDGILTAQEAGALNLQNTWLVVLSACDTGIGEARNGEGVLGLRRGFVQAGAQNLLMTLWPISDKWSVEIMKAFYEKAMVSGDAPQAMAEVQAEWLARLRKEKGVLIAARIAGPFVLSTRGRQSSK
jgi:CHAT domain-containing protein/Tfp pilus assembly protein PilF